VKRRKVLKPSAGTTSSIEHVEASDIGQHMTHETLLEREKWIWLLVIYLRPDVEHVG
jgi:hypothetical protein